MKKDPNWCIACHADDGDNICERDSLREALEKIAALPCGDTTGMWPCANEGPPCATCIARAALGKEPAGGR